MNTFNVYHVYPLNEEKEHVLKANWKSCECIPKLIPVIENGIQVGCVIAHSSFDGRELLEEAEFIKNTCI